MKTTWKVIRFVASRGTAFTVLGLWFIELIVVATKKEN